MPKSIALYYICVAGCLLANAIQTPSASSAEPDFEREVAPLLVQRCLECHGSADASGGLDLSQHKSLLRGGDSGSAIESMEKSLLLDRLTSGEMPPEKNGRSQALPPNEVAVFRAWIEAGAKWPEGRVLDLFERTTAKRAGRDWWAWQPLKKTASVADAAGIRSDAGSVDHGKTAIAHSPVQDAVNPIDHFIQEKLAEKNLTAAPAADRRTLLRRVYFDLIGLPPTDADVIAFERDESPDAYERVVDHLLDSKQFGERWARHWLE